MLDVAAERGDDDAVDVELLKPVVVLGVVVVVAAVVNVVVVRGRGRVLRLLLLLVGIIVEMMIRSMITAMTK